MNANIDELHHLQSYIVALNKADDRTIQRTMSKLNPMLFDECTKLNRARIDWERSNDGVKKLHEKLWKSENQVKKKVNQLSQLKMERGLGAKKGQEVDKMQRLFELLDKEDFYLARKTAKQLSSQIVSQLQELVEYRSLQNQVAKEVGKEACFNPSMFSGFSFSSERKHMVTRVRQSEKIRSKVNQEILSILMSTFMSHDAKHFPKVSDLISSKVLDNLKSMFITFNAAKEQLREHSEMMSDEIDRINQKRAKIRLSQLPKHGITLIKLLEQRDLLTGQDLSSSSLTAKRGSRQDIGTCQRLRRWLRHNLDLVKAVEPGTKEVNSLKDDQVTDMTVELLEYMNGILQSSHIHKTMISEYMKKEQEYKAVIAQLYAKVLKYTDNAPVDLGKSTVEDSIAIVEEQIDCFLSNFNQTLTETPLERNRVKSPPASPAKKEEEDEDQVPEMVNRLISSRVPQEEAQLNEAGMKLQATNEDLRRYLQQQRERNKQLENNVCDLRRKIKKQDTEMRQSFCLQKKPIMATEATINLEELRLTNTKLKEENSLMQERMKGIEQRRRKYIQEVIKKKDIQIGQLRLTIRQSKVEYDNLLNNRAMDIQCEWETKKSSRSGRSQILNLTQEVGVGLSPVNVKHKSINTSQKGSLKEIPLKYNRQMNTSLREEGERLVMQNKSVNTSEKEKKELINEPLMLHQVSVGESVELEEEDCEAGSIEKVESESKEVLRGQLMRTQELMEQQVVINKQQSQQLENERDLIKRLDGEILQLRDQLQARSTLNVTPTSPSSSLHLFPFGGAFGYEQTDQRRYLIEELTSRVGQLRNTVLLYKMDRYNKTNFHKYIDGEYHVVVVIKTIYGKLISAYSQKPFSSGGVQKGHGLIMSLWNRQTWSVKAEMRAITYDDYYLIFGNSELRVKALQWRVFSNFGIMNSFYDCRGSRVDALLGEAKEREVGIAALEVYGLQLQS